MDPELYRAAMEGDLEVLVQHKDQLEVQVTPNNNSVLHIVALFNNNSTLVKEILTAQPLLLCRVNTKGETSLHIAAREGHYYVVQALIESAKELVGHGELENGVGMAKKMSRTMNEDGDTALHEAMWNDHPNVAILLVEEDPEFSHPANNVEETPLYLAAEKGYLHILSKILNTCTSPVYSGPDGRTALHAAVINNFQGCTKQLLEWRQSLVKEPDIRGWTPLHYAARYGYLSRVRQLLYEDKSVAYNTAYEDNKKTALHIAATWGKTFVMEELISRCPDCWEMVDSKGQNILHMASSNRQCEVIAFIMKRPRLSSLINQKDQDGNTPLHLLATLGFNEINSVLGKKYVRNMIKDPRVDKDAFNKEKLTPLDIVYGDGLTKVKGLIKNNLEIVGAVRGRRNVVNRDNNLIAGRRKAQTEKSKPLPLDIRKRADTHLIVAAFIATVTFAAGFTIPGGYNGSDGDNSQNQGKAVLTKVAAFKAFVIADALAMILSTFAVFLHFMAVSFEEPDKIARRYATAQKFIFLSMGAMVIAFMTGMYAVLDHSLAIYVSLVGSLYFFLLFFRS